MKRDAQDLNFMKKTTRAKTSTLNKDRQRRQMSDFFDSEFVQDAIQDINELQEEIYTEVFTFDKLDNEEKLEHLDKLDNLLEKQRNLYTRMTLSDDPRAKEMRDNVRKSAIMMGFPKDVDCGVLFANMQKTLLKVREQIS